MRKFTTFALAAVLFAGIAQAQSASRSSVLVGKVDADESSHIDIVRGNIQTQLNNFIGGQRIIINQLQDIINNELSPRLQELCVMLYHTINVNGTPVTMPIAVPAPGVTLPPDVLAQFCQNVIDLENAGGPGNDPVITPPFLRGTLPPICNPATQDLTWNNNQWECVTTFTGRCTAASATPPVWVPVP